MEIYFSDRNFNIIGMASTNLPNAIRIYEDKEINEVETGISTFEGKIYFTDDENGNIDLVTEMTKRGNYILYKNRYNQSKYFTIIDTEKDRKSNYVNFYCEDAGLDLLNEVVTEFAADKAYPIDWYIKKFTWDSGYEIGINEISNLSRKLEWEGEATVTERLNSICTQFDDAELDFSFEIVNMAVAKKYINIYKKRGNDLGIDLRLNEHVDNIITKESIANLATGLRVTGGTPEGDNKPINLKGYNYDDGRFFISPSGFLLDRVANVEWSRFINEIPKDNLGYIIKSFSYDTLSKSELLNRSLGQLKKINHPEQNFEVDIIKLPDNVYIGDRVNIIDENDKLYLSTRVLELTIEESNNLAYATLGENIIKYSNVDSRLQELADQLKFIKPGDTFYPAVRYADDDKGNGFSEAQIGKSYMAIIYQLNNPSPSNNPKDYEGKWIEIKGGAGVPGKDGTTKYMWVKYSDTVSGTNMSDSPDGKQYIGIAYNKDSKIASTNPKDYEWALYKGPKGDEGPAGSQGVPGPKGTDGKTTYTWIKYADDKNGIGMSDSPEGKLYMGIAYNKVSITESGNPEDYKWSLIKGSDGTDGIQGPRGEQGVPGPKGTDGKTTYTHIAYANSADGKQDFSVSNSNRNYIGMYVDFNINDSTDPAKYAWSLIKGADGTNGTPGKPGVDGKTPYFHTAWAMSDDGKTGFSTTVSTGKTHLGTYTDFTQADSNDPTKYSWSLIKGEQGEQGIPGPIGPDGKPTYTWIKYATNASGAGMSDNPSGKDYIGFAYNKNTATESTNPADYTWSLYKGPQGNNGATSYTHYAWADSKDGSVGFSTTVSTGKKYMGVYTDFVAAGSSDRTKYKWVDLANSMEVGVRNYLLDSGVTVTNNAYNIKNYNYTEKIPEGTQVVVTIWGSLGAGKQFGLWNSGGSVNIGYLTQISTGVYQATLTWKVGSSNNTFLSVYTVPSTTTVNSTINKISIVKGNKPPLDWMPAQEDANVSINKINNALNEIYYPLVQPNTPPNGKENQQWWKTDTSGNVTGYYVWQSGKWKPQTIQQSILNITTLNAVTITGGKITGTEIQSSKFINSGTTTAYGSTTLMDYVTSIQGNIRMDWKIQNSTQNGYLNVDPSGVNAASFSDAAQKTKQWYWELTNAGLVAGSGSATTGNLVQGGFGPNGLTMSDYRYAKYGSVNLQFQDLINVGETEVSSYPGFSSYSQSSMNRPTATRNGRVVQLKGAIKNTNELPAGWSGNICVVPEWCRPKNPVNQLVQGTGANIFLITVSPDGNISMERYRGNTGGNFEYKACGAGSWLNIACIYAAGDL